MTAERLADNYAPILLSGVRIRRLRISFCPSSSSATLNGRAKCGTQFRQVAVTSWMCQHAAKGWLQRLVRLYRLLARESHRAIWGVIYFGSNCEATLMIGRIQREGFDLAGIYFTNAEGMRAGCGRNDRGSRYEFFSSAGGCSRTSVEIRWSRSCIRRGLSSRRSLNQW